MCRKQVYVFSKLWFSYFTALYTEKILKCIFLNSNFKQWRQKITSLNKNSDFDIVSGLKSFSNLITHSVYFSCTKNGQSQSILFYYMCVLLFNPRQKNTSLLTKFTVHPTRMWLVLESCMGRVTCFNPHLTQPRFRLSSTLLCCSSGRVWFIRFFKRMS